MKMRIKTAIGKRIREKRLEKSWTQEYLAEMVDLSPVYIGVIERGKKLPSMETFIRILNALEVSADDILCDVANEQFVIKPSPYSEKFEKLSPRALNYVFSIIDVYAGNCHK